MQRRYIDAALDIDRADQKKLRYKKFKPSWVKPGSIVLMIGKKGTGKTTLMLDICHALRHCPEVILFQKTIDTNEAFKDIVPGLFCYKYWSTETMKKVLDRHVRENKKRIKQKKPVKYLTIIIDDQAGDEKFCNDPFLSDLFFNCRWYKLNIIFTMQYSMKVKIDQRAQIDWVFMLRENIESNRKRLLEHYCGHYGSGQKGLTAFGKVFDQFTENRGCMVVKNTGLSNQITENIYHYRATMRNFNEDPSLPRWKMGSKAFWAFHHRHFNPHWDSSADDEENSDIVITR